MYFHLLLLVYCSGLTFSWHWNLYFKLVIIQTTDYRKKKISKQWKLVVLGNITAIFCLSKYYCYFYFSVVSINVQKLQEVAIGNFIPHPATVITLTLTSIRTETTSEFRLIIYHAFSSLSKIVEMMFKKNLVYLKKYSSKFCWDHGVYLPILGGVVEFPQIDWHQIKPWFYPLQVSRLLAGSNMRSLPRSRSRTRRRASSSTWRENCSCSSGIAPARSPSYPTPRKDQWDLSACFA